jgi:hypothetical protein
MNVILRIEFETDDDIYLPTMSRFRIPCIHDVFRTQIIYKNNIRDRLKYVLVEVVHRESVNIEYITQIETYLVFKCVIIRKISFLMIFSSTF